MIMIIMPKMLMSSDTNTHVLTRQPPLSHMCTHTDLVKNHGLNDDLNKSLDSDGLVAKDIILEALEAGLLDFVSLSSLCDLQTERIIIIQMRTGPGDPPTPPRYKVPLQPRGELCCCDKAEAV